MNRLIRIFICVMMIATLAFSSILLVSCGSTKDSGEFVSDEKDSDISIGVLADVHVMSETQAVDMTCADFKAWEAHGQKMLGLSESILKTAVDRIIAESDFDVVLVSGDNADDGGEVSHRAIAAELARLEQAGIKVFTIPGNHDINNKSYTYAGGKASYTNPTTEKEFAEIYADFGYDGEDIVEYYKSAESDPKDVHFEIGDNLSYVADLPGDYRLIAIDMCNYVSTYSMTKGEGDAAAAGGESDDEGYFLLNGERYPLVSGRHDGAMTEDLLLWAKRVTEDAVKAGKKPVGMMHFPLIQHFGKLVQAENGAVNDPKGYSVPDVLANAGMRFIFTGHIHMQDDAMYTSAKGASILDVNSASLCNYPTPIRYFRGKGDEYEVRTWNMSYITEKYLPSYLTAEEKSAINSDFRDYSVKYLDGSMLAKVKNKIDMEMVYKILSKLGVKKDGTNDAKVEALAMGVYNDVILKFLKLPLYKSGTSDASVEGYAKKYGASLPKSDYTDVFNLAMSFVAGVYGGDECCAADETRVTLLKYSIYAALALIDEYGLFAKIREINPSFKEIDLSVALPTLYKNGNLDVCKSNLLVGLLSSLKIEIKGIKITDKTNPYDALNTIGRLKETNALPQKVQDMLTDIDVKKYISSNKTQEIGFIKLGAIIDDYIASSLLIGLTNDSLEEGNTFTYGGGTIDTAPADNNVRITINQKTMAYSALK